MYVVVQNLVRPKHSVNKTTGKESYQVSGFAFPKFPVMMPAIPYNFYVDAAFRDFVGYGLVNLSIENGDYSSLKITKYGHVFVPLNADQIASLTSFMSPIVSAIDSIRNEESAPAPTGSSVEMQMLQQQIMQQAAQQAEVNKQLLEMMRNNGVAPASAPAASAPTNHAAPVTQRPDEKKNVFENAASPAVK